MNTFKRNYWVETLIIILILGSVGINFLWSQNTMARQDSIKQSEIAVTKAPVVFQKTVLFNIYGSYGPYSAAERAATVTSRLEELSINNKVFPDSFAIVMEGENLNIVLGEFVILSITHDDETIAGKPMQKLAEEYIRVLKTDFYPLVAKTTLKSTIISIVKIAVTLLIVACLLFFLIKLINRLFKWLIKNSMVFKQKNQEGLYLKGIRFLTGEQIDASIKVILRFIKVVIIVIVIYVVIYIVLLTLPFTRGIAHKLQSYITTPLFSAGRAIINFIPNLFFIAIILLIAKYVINLLRYIAREIEEERIWVNGFYPDWVKPTFSIVKFLVFFFVAIIIFPYLPGSDSPAFKGISIFVGVLFSLGSSSAIANMIAGIILTYMRPYKIGDMIEIGDKFGQLMETTLLLVRLKTPKNEIITIPNSIILSGHIINYSKNELSENLILHTSVTIGYDTPWRKVHELLIQAAQMTEGILQDKEPFVLQKSLDDYYVAYELNAYTNQPGNMPRIYSQLHQNIQDCFRDGNVEIMSPAYTSFRNGNEKAIPKKEN